MRMLYVTSDKYPPYRVDVVDLFARELTSRGHTIDWLMQSAADGARRYRTTWLGGVVWVGAADTGRSLPARLHRNLQDIANDLCMISLIRRGTYDVVQVRDKFFAALVAICCTRRGPTRFTYWLSYPFPEAALYRARTGMSRFPVLDRLRGRLLHFVLYRVIARYAAHIFVQSEQMKTELSAEGIPAHKMTPVPMGVALERAAACADASEAGVPTVVYLGDLGRVRRIDFLIRAFRYVVDKIPIAHLVLVGEAEDPADVTDLQRLAAVYRIADRVEFTGFLPTQEAWRVVARASVGASPIAPNPIFHRASPTKPIEYFALGKPVVANEHPDQSKLISESNGGICVPYEERAFGEALVRLLDDRQLAERMGANGRRFVATHRSYGVIADNVERVYAALLDSPAPLAAEIMGPVRR